MADDENDSISGSEKPEIKENTSESEDAADKEDLKSETSKKEEKGQKKTEKNQKKDEKSSKKEKVKEEEDSKDDDDDGDDDDDDDGDDDDDDDEELPPGLLERPLEVEGKREKKKVERLSATMIRSPQEKKKLEIEEGAGKKLGDIPYVEFQVNSTKAIDLKPLHRVLFLRAGTNNEIKKNIKQFSGFTHDKDSKEHEKRLACLNKMVTAELKAICIVLGLERGGTKGNLVDRVMDFLMKPQDKGLSVKTKAKKRSKSAGGKKEKSTKKKRKSKETAKKGKKDDDSSPGEDSDEEEEEEEEEEEQEEEEEEEESEDEAPKKKKAKTENKKKTPKKSVKENGRKEKPAPKKETKKLVVKKKPAAELSESLSEDSEDEPIAKMKKSPPTNEEIKDLVKKILDGADLETVTMKTVVKQVYAKYPSFDLSNRKDFIKDTVREVIS